jgi:uncharacterized protein with gpF-like domain
MASYGSLSFAEQVAFFRQKLNLPTQRWDDLLGAAHDRAFVVAGATSADLLADLNAAVTRAIEQGVSIQQFRADFESIVAKHGWTGWTGEGTEAGRAWRARVIYETNLRTSHAAGRYAQLQELKAKRPYWRYRHNDTVRYPREHHVALDGLVLPADHPFWQTAYPPNGFGCRCFVESLSEAQMRREGLQVGRAPDDFKPDRGWDYAPGASLLDESRALLERKAATLPPTIARSWLTDILGRTAGATWRSLRAFAQTLLDLIR